MSLDLITQRVLDVAGESGQLVGDLWWSVRVNEDVVRVQAGTREQYTNPLEAFEAAMRMQVHILGEEFTLRWPQRISAFGIDGPDGRVVGWHGAVDLGIART